MTDLHDPQEVQISEREVLFQGFYRMDRLRLRHELYRGGMSQELQRELFVRPDAVAVLPYDPRKDQVVLVEQFRVGAQGKMSRPWLLEAVAGLVDKVGEDLVEVARREAQEEAGLVLQRLLPITSYLPSPGGCDECIHLFLGECDSRSAGGVFGLEEEGEDILARVMAPEQALAEMNGNTLVNGNTLIALQWLLLNRQKVRELWR